jgi:hypothetical protein
MICDTCHGAGFVLTDPGPTPVLPTGGVEPGDPTPSLKQPCPTCGGSGIASCCDGMVER